MSPLADGLELRISWAYARGADAGRLRWGVELRGGAWVASASTDDAGEPLAVVGARVVRGPAGELIVATLGGELRAVVGAGESAPLWYATTTLWGAMGIAGGRYEAPTVELARAEVGQRG
ncbi:MAG: hypothetical protein WAZ94_10165 [Phycisphaerales bacterium]